MAPRRRRPSAPPSEPQLQKEYYKLLEEAHPVHLTREELKTLDKWLTRPKAQGEAPAQPTANTATGTGSKGKEPTGKKEEAKRAVPDAAETEGNTGANETTGQGGTRARYPLKGALKKTKPGKEAEKKTEKHLDKAAVPDGTAVTAGRKPQSGRTSHHSVPGIPNSVTRYPPERSNETAEHRASAECSGCQTQADSQDAGATAVTHSTCSPKTANDKADGTATKPRAVEPDLVNRRHRRPTRPAQTSSQKPGAAVPRGATNQNQAQQPLAGKRGEGSTRPAPDNIQRKGKAQDTLHAATPPSKEHGTAATISVAPQPSSTSPPLADSPSTGQGPSEQSVRAPDRPVTTRKRRAASAPIEDEGQGRKRSRLGGEGEEDWRAAPVIFARRPQDSVDNTERDGDAPVEGPASGVWDVRIQGGRGGGQASAENGQQLDLPEKPSSIELTRGYGAVMGIAFGAGAFALRHWT